MTLTYQIDKTTLLENIAEEVSKAADEAYGDQGVSLYDSVVLTTKDEAEVGRMLEDAVRALAARTFDVCRRASITSNSTTTDNLQFYLPDFDPSFTAEAQAEISRFLVLHTCAQIFRQRRAEKLPEYAERAQASLDRAVALLKSRKSPAEQW